MNETHEQLIKIGTGILSASRSELYLSMRFLDKIGRASCRERV